VLDCSASIEVPDFPYHTELNFFPTSPAKFPLISNQACGPASPPRESRLLFVFIDTIFISGIYSSFAKKTKYKYSKSCLLQFSRNEVPAKTETNNNDINRGYYMVAWRYEISLLVLKHSKRNFVSLRGHVISSISELPSASFSKQVLVFFLSY